MSDSESPRPGGTSDGGVPRGDFSDLHRLMIRTLEDGDAPEHAELAERLAGDEAARDFYVEYMQDTSALRAHALCRVDDASASRSRGRDLLGHHDAAAYARARGVRSWLAIAVGLLLAVGAYLYDSRWLGGGAAVQIATIVRVTDVAWSGDRAPAPRPLTRLAAGETLEFDSGQLEIVFDTGVELLVTGPAAMSVDSPLLVTAARGAYAARVGDGGKGFTIETPATSVRDLGTEFGVSIQSDQETGVVVFDGAVDVTPADRPAASAGAPPIRLNQGEALSVSRGGDAHRIVAMYADQYPMVAGRPGAGNVSESLFEDVTDNLTASGSKKFYRVVPRGFGEDARAFVDRQHEWNGVDREGLPSFLVGGDYVMPFNDNKFLDGLEVTVRLRSACDIYVLFDQNMIVPDWLRDRFTDTGYRVGLDHGLGPFTGSSSTQVGPGEGIRDEFRVWKRRVGGAGEIVLGGAAEPADKQLGWNMYGVVAVAAPGAEDRP